MIRSGVEYDLRKCFVDGKSLILEGVHIDPGLYLSTDDVRRLQSAENEEPMPRGVIVAFIPTLDKGDQTHMMEHWLSGPQKDKLREVPDIRVRMLKNIDRLQQRMLELAPSGAVNVVPVNVVALEETLDNMHAIVLDKLEEAYKEGLF